MSSPLTQTELEELREKLRELRLKIFATRQNLIDERKITLQQFLKMRQAQDVISQCIQKINDEIFTQILTNIQQPKQEIEFSIDRARKGIAELQEINKILQFVNLAVQLVGNIALTIGTGNVANIATIIDDISQLPI